MILDLDRREAVRAEKRLFIYPDINGEPEESRHEALSPYLFDAGGLSDPHPMVREESALINGMVRLVSRSQPIDDGECIFNADERSAFLEIEPETQRFMHPYIGARPYLQGGERSILALHGPPPEVLARLPRVRERIAAVRAFRQRSKRKSTHKLSETPTLWRVTRREPLTGDRPAVGSQSWNGASNGGVRGRCMARTWHTKSGQSKSLSRLGTRCCQGVDTQISPHWAIAGAHL